MSRDREDFTNAAVLGLKEPDGLFGAHVIKTVVDGQPALAVRVTFANHQQRSAFMRRHFDPHYQDEYRDVPDTSKE